MMSPTIDGYHNPHKHYIVATSDVHYAAMESMLTCLALGGMVFLIVTFIIDCIFDNDDDDAPGAGEAAGDEMERRGVEKEEVEEEEEDVADDDGGAYSLDAQFGGSGSRLNLTKEFQDTMTSSKDNDDDDDDNSQHHSANNECALNLLCTWLTEEEAKLLGCRSEKEKKKENEEGQRRKKTVIQSQKCIRRSSNHHHLQHQHHYQQQKQQIKQNATDNKGSDEYLSSPPSQEENSLRRQRGNDMRQFESRPGRKAQRWMLESGLSSAVQTLRRSLKEPWIAMSIDSNTIIVEDDIDDLPFFISSNCSLPMNVDPDGKQRMRTTISGSRITTSGSQVTGNNGPLQKSTSWRNETSGLGNNTIENDENFKRVLLLMMKLIRQLRSADDERAQIEIELIKTIEQITRGISSNKENDRQTRGRDEAAAAAGREPDQSSSKTSHQRCRSGCCCCIRSSSLATRYDPDQPGSNHPYDPDDQIHPLPSFF